MNRDDNMNINMKSKRTIKTGTFGICGENTHKEEDKFNF